MMMGEVNMKSLRYLYLAGIALLALILAGCGGGGGGGRAVTGGTGFLATIGADAGAGGGGLSRSRGTAIVAKLDAGATIQAFDFTTGALLATGTIGTDGKGTINLPPGKTVAVVVKGTCNGKPYRLSLIIPAVVEDNSEYIAGPAETLAAEALAEKYYGKGTVIDTGTWEDVLEAATTLLGDEANDMSVGGGFVAGTTFGAAGSIDPEKAGDVIAAVPETIDDNLAKAKNAVLMVNRAGVPFKVFVDEEVPDLTQVAEETKNGITDVHLEDFADKYRILGERLGEMFFPAINGDYWYGSDTIGIDNLEVGKAYKLVDTRAGHQYELQDYPAGNVAGVVTIIKENVGDTLTLTSRESGGTWTLTERSTADTLLNYTVILPDSEPAGANPTITANISLRDKYITTPITLTGTVSLAGPDGGPYTTAVFTGTLTSLEVNATSQTTLKFPATVPVGAPEGWSTYYYPTEITLNSLYGRFAAGGLVATVSGAYSMKMTPTQVMDDLLPLPTEITLTNAALSVSGNEKSFSLSGSGGIKISYPEGGVDPNDIAHQIFPTEFNITNLSASLNGGQVTATGSLSLKGQVILMDGTDSVFPTEVGLNGTYVNTHSGTSFTGALTGKWDNPGDDPTLKTVHYTLTATGTLKRAHYQDFDADLKFETDGLGGATLTVTKLGWATQYLTGTVIGTFNADGTDIATAELDLTSQDGVLFHMHKDLTGEVSVGATKVGDIEQSGGGVRVLFTDDYVEYLIGAAP